MLYDDAACVDVCPVDCIHPRKDEPEFESASILYIHPEECINCGLCLSICPVDAIHYDEELPEEARPFAAVNREFFGAEVSGLGDPGGWDKSVSVETDHPLVAARPKPERQPA